MGYLARVSPEGRTQALEEAVAGRHHDRFVLGDLAAELLLHHVVQVRRCCREAADDRMFVLRAGSAEEVVDEHGEWHLWMSVPPLLQGVEGKNLNQRGGEAVPSGEASTRESSIYGHVAEPQQPLGARLVQRDGEDRERKPSLSRSLPEEVVVNVLVEVGEVP